MQLENNVLGKRIQLRTAIPEDAEFILRLRLDPRLNRFIHGTDSSVEKQRDYILMKQTQENDCHMIIEKHDGNRLGVVAVYEIDPVKKTFTWGRWIIDPSEPGYAVETAILVYHFAFTILNLETALMDVQKENTRVVEIHKKMGAELIRTDEENVYFRFPKSSLRHLLEKYKDRHSFKYD